MRKGQERFTTKNTNLPAAGREHQEKLEPQRTQRNREKLKTAKGRKENKVVIQTRIKYGVKSCEVRVNLKFDSNYPSLFH